MIEAHRDSRLSPSSVALLVMLLAALVFVAASVPTLAPAAGKKSLLIPGAFRLAASNGYTLYVIATPSYRKRPGLLEIYAYDKGKGAIYRAPATVTDTSIQADLGEVGEISVTFQRSGKAISVLCGDREVRFDSGSYEGTISFHGEEGFTSAEATTVPGNIDYVRSFCGDGYFESESGSNRSRGAELYVRNPALGQEMAVSKRGPSAPAGIVAWTREYTAGGISIRRYTESQIPAGDFRYDRRLRTATVSPPSPFAGSARFDRGKKAGQRWSGDLTVDLPGRSNVPLTGTSLRATLGPAF